MNKLSLLRRFICTDRIIWVSLSRVDPFEKLSRIFVQNVQFIYYNMPDF